MSVSVYGQELAAVKVVKNADALWEARRRKSEKAFQESQFRNAEEPGSWVEKENQWVRSFRVPDASVDGGLKEMIFVVEFKRNAAVVVGSYFLDDEAY